MDPEVVVAPVAPVVETPAPPEPAPTSFDAPDVPLPAVDPAMLEAVNNAIKPPEPKLEEPPKPEEPEKPAEPVPPVDPKLEEPPKVEPEKRPSDEFGELPENTTVKTKERFETMRSKYDDLHKAHETTKQQLDEEIDRSTRWADTIKSTGTNPEQFGLLMGYARAINSGTREGLEEAFSMMQNEMQVLAKALGKEAPGFDPLDNFQDLKEKVEDGAISRELALELAEARAGKNLKIVKPEADPVKVHEERRAAALQGLVAVGNRLRTDPHYAAKSPMLQVITETVIKSEPDPDKWPALIEAQFKKIPNPAPVAAAPTIPSVPTPIRPGVNSSGNVDKVASTIEEAVAAAINFRR